MVNQDVATVREFMFCTRNVLSQIKNGKVILQFIKKKLISLDKFPPLNYHKTLNLPFLPPPTKIF